MFRECYFYYQGDRYYALENQHGDLWVFEDATQRELAPKEVELAFIQMETVEWQDVIPEACDYDYDCACDEGDL